MQINISKLVLSIFAGISIIVAVNMSALYASESDVCDCIVLPQILLTNITNLGKNLLLGYLVRHDNSIIMDSETDGTTWY